MTYLLRFAITALLPGIRTLPPGELDLSTFISRFRRETTRLLWVTALASAALFMLSPLVTIFVPLPAVLLPAGLLDRHASAMAGHRVYVIRQAAFLLKMIGGLYWGAQPSVRARFELAAYPADPGTWRRS